TLVTQGAAGAEWRQGEARLQQRGFPVEAVDSTGAGDCFAGYVVAGLEAGRGPEEAMTIAAAAAALSVTRPGAAEAVPDRAEVERFLSP
ncbi:MAG TPA: ribokinase, partial [Roseovarius nubinhibens]|nr:ribokinase [Roseovarius nubinhibens]